MFTNIGLYSNIAKMNGLKYIPKNTKGRDFIVGDLHGCKSLLMHALERQSFNPLVDRVFCTGDLVDRGPESYETLLLLEQPWFHSVAGNHEVQLLRVLSEDCTDSEAALFATNGGLWFFALSDEQRFYLKDVLQEKIEALPLIMRVESEAGLFQVAHAELCDSQGRTLTDKDLEDEDLKNHRSSIQYGRSRITWALKNLRCPAEGPDGFVDLGPKFDQGLTLTYVGHTIVPYPILFRSHFYVDGGANRAYRNKVGRLMLLEHGAGAYSHVCAGDLLAA